MNRVTSVAKAGFSLTASNHRVIRDRGPKPMNRLLLFLSMAGWLASASSAHAQACASCSSGSIPDTVVRSTVSWTANNAVIAAATGAGVYNVVVSSASVPLPAGLPAGAYPAWCGTGPRDAVSSQDFTATSMPTVSTTVWNEINYVLNHKRGTISEVQEAIWVLLGTMTVAAVNAQADINAIVMYNDAIAYGGNYVPAPGKRIGLLLRTSRLGYQDLILELVNCASIGDRVWMDTNGNAAPDPGEPGLNGVIVQLLNSAGAVIASTLTSPSPRNYPFAAAGMDGWYQFSGLCPGNYRVSIDAAQAALRGATPVSPTSAPVTLGSYSDESIRFGFTGGPPPLNVTCPEAYAMPRLPYWSRAQVTGGAAPYAFAWTGSMPAGLSMDATGTIIGTVPLASAPGTYSFTALVSAAGAIPASAACSITVAPPLAVQCPQGPARSGQVYSGGLAGSGGSGSYAFGVTTPDTFVPGLSLNALTGEISGAPAVTGSYRFTVAIDDAAGVSMRPETASCSINVTEALALQGPSPAATKGTPYSSALVVSGGSPPYTFSIAGALPAGLTLNPATGQIAGVPLQEGTFTFTAQVRDSGGSIATVSSGITTAPAFAVLCPSATGYSGFPYTSPVLTAGGTGPFTYLVLSGGALPRGLALNAATGLLSGAPSLAGTFPFTVQAADGASGATQLASCSVQIYSPPALQCPTPSGIAGLAYSSRLSATGGAGSYSMALAPGFALPLGWALDALNGAISGSNPLAGSFSFAAQVTDSAGTSSAAAQASCSITIVPLLAVTCGNTAAQAGVPYSSVVSASGGKPPYSYALAAGALPAGLSMDLASGALNGTPWTPGASPFTVSASDASGQSVSSSCSITVAPAPPAVSCPVPSGQATVAYASSFAVTGGVAPYTYSLASGSLPTGLTLNPSTGVVSGTPTAGSTFNFVAQVMDGRATAAGSGVASCVIRTSPAPLTLTAPTNIAQAGIAYSSAVAAGGGVAPYTYSIASGSLPPGLTLYAATGGISGTPASSGTFTFTIMVSDVAGSKTDSSGSIVVAVAPPTAACPSPTGQVSVPYSSSLAVRGGVAPYTFSLASGSLPTGLALNPLTGSVAGIPAVAGTVAFVAQTVDARGASTGAGTAACSIKTSPDPLKIAWPSVTGKVSVTFSGAFAASGGAGPYIFSISSGSIPKGLTLNAATGSISGVPASSGTSIFGGKVTDSAGASATVSASIVIAAATNACPVSWGDWKNHQSTWPAKSLTLGSQTYNATELAALLAMPVAGDASINLAHQLIAAKLNILNTSDSRVALSIAAADLLLFGNPGKLPYGVSPSSVAGQAMNTQSEWLATYNSSCSN
jgi:hypothetical protein